MTVSIRPARPADRELCIGFIETLNDSPATGDWHATFDRLLGLERGMILIADDSEDGVLGVATISFNLAIRFGGEYCQLEELYVDPKARGRNAGGLLIEAVLAAARGRGCAEVGVHITERFSNNRPFYEKYGFVYTGEEVRQAL